MKQRKKIILGALVLFFAVVTLAGWYLRRHTIPVLQPAGPIAEKERNLMIFCVLISVIVVVPVFTMLILFAWRYREGNKNAKYSPDLGGSPIAEIVWWLIPAAIICIIGVVTWRSSYALDPFKPLNSSKPTLHIQVVALDWKWLFIYPGQNVASVNEAAIPVNTPVDFEITSDTVMTSFWDPQLAGQMYAMPGMETQLNLEASKTGSFNGVAANISGAGFAGMSFMVKSMPQQNYTSWVASARRSGRQLTTGSYAKLAQPSSYVQPSYYSSVKPGLYDTIMLKYMTPTEGNTAITAAGTSS